MKALFNYPAIAYLLAALTSLVIMVIIDYFLGAEAEHLNAWVIINRLFGRTLGIPDSLAIRYFGLFGATLLMLLVNFLSGFILLNLYRVTAYLYRIIF